MATRQQLRGDGSKEYQIITNLSRGINNAVADDVLVDNAFRDVVNFSSDQLGNISKRDNLLNSNFKEFIRKLAYGDFNLDTFKIEDYTEGRDSTPTEGIPTDYGYKNYSYGRIDQIILQNFYEMMFTDRHYKSSSLYSTLSGVTKDSEGNYMKVPTYAGSPFLDTEEAKTLKLNYDYTIDAEIVDDTSKFNDINYAYTLNQDLDNKTYTYTLSCTNLRGELLTVDTSSLPDGWTLSSDGKHIYKIYDDDFWEDVVVSFYDGTTLITKKTSVAYSSVNNLGKVDAYTFAKVIKDRGDYYEVYLAHAANSDGRTITPYSMDGDYGWVITDVTKEECPELVITSPRPIIHKKFYKSELNKTDVKLMYFYDLLGCTPVSVSFIKNSINVAQPTYYRLPYYAFDIFGASLKKIYIIQQNNFFKALQNLDKIFKEGDYVNNTTLDEDIVFDAYFILNAKAANTFNRLLRIYDFEGTLANQTGLFAYNAVQPLENANSINNCVMIYRLNIRITSNYSIKCTPFVYTYGDSYFFIKSEQLGSNVRIDSSFKPNNAFLSMNITDIDLTVSKYNNNLYFSTGYNSLLKLVIVEDNPTKYVESIGSNNDINITTGSASSKILKNSQVNLYKPVPYEVTNPGFNILADNPLSWIEEAGNVEKIRGVFYTTADGSNVLQTVPCNIPFNIHVITTGAGNPETPKIRPNNGELDEGKNPYTNLPGSWKSSTVFACSGVDTVEAYEMVISKGTDKFLTYFTPTAYVPKDVGNINEVSSLVFKCPRCKVINNQLVLFGNSGYIFFSDFENFKYFPNYYYVYVTQSDDEEIVDIVYFRQFYAIFTNKRILRMSGDFGADNFELGPLNDFMGCVNHNTIRQVYNSLYFVGYNGIYSLNQGYLGTGTENLKRVDTQLTNTFNFDNVAYCYVMGSTYIIVMTDGKTWYTYDVDNDMFLRYNYNLGEGSILSNINFIETLEENQIYAILVTNKEGRNYADDLLLYNFPLAKDVNYDYKDSDQGYISAFETPYINLGTPTNTKKFKTLFIKMYNETDSLIPLYVTVYVDDILAISPEDYVVELDEETNTYYYYFKVDNNAELLKAHNVLGELTLGKDTLGDNIIQQLKLKVNAKGRAIKIILADGYDYPNKDNSAIIKYRNNKKFSISTIGIVYKLKKVKEG